MVSLAYQFFSLLFPPWERNIKSRTTKKKNPNNNNNKNSKQSPPQKKNNPKPHRKKKKNNTKTSRNNLFSREMLKCTKLQVRSLEYRLNTKISISNTSIRQQHLYFCSICLHCESLHSSYTSQFWVLALKSFQFNAALRASFYVKCCICTRT